MQMFLLAIVYYGINAFREFDLVESAYRNWLEFWQGADSCCSNMY